MAALLIALAILTATVLVLQLLGLPRRKLDISPLEALLDRLQTASERTERLIREELTSSREEAATADQRTREELAVNVKGASDLLAQQLKTNQEATVGSIGEMAKLQRAQLDLVSGRLDKLSETNESKLAAMRETIEERLGKIQTDASDRLDKVRTDSAEAALKAREEVQQALKTFADGLTSTLKEMGEGQRLRLDGMIEQLGRLTDSTESRLNEVKTSIDQHLEQIHNTSTEQGRLLREDLGKMTDTSQQSMAQLRTMVEERLKVLQEDNTKQLEQVRATVDEKLQGTLERRLTESFSLVSERLEQVHKGLGEMQALATGVGDLKKVLSNVRTRGTVAEIQLGSMLEEVLTPEQYGKNVATKGGGERVEYAVRLPGRSDGDEPVWLPIDAKFPTEDYQRLQDALERADPVAAEAAARQLESTIKQCADDIADKYLNPPTTTDFGILFLPTEGLFAEAVRRPGLVRHVQGEFRVVIAGPTTLWAILTSLQVGFRTLAIEKRSSEVWNLLAAIKTEWSKYGEVLAKVQKKLQEASNTVDDVAKRSRVIGRKLSDVQLLPAPEAENVLAIDEAAPDDIIGEDLEEEQGAPPEFPAATPIASVSEDDDIPF